MKQVLILILLTPLIATAQVQLQFNPAIDGLTLDRLGNVRIVSNLPGVAQARLQITITGQTGTVLKVSTPAFDLHPGPNIPPAQTLGNASYAFAGNAGGQHLARTHKLDDGEYDFCFQLTLTGTAKGVEDFYEQCFPYAVHQNTPLVLVDPYDREKTCNQRPNLLWQPGLPADPTMTYTVILTPEKNQTPAEAINFNQAQLFVTDVPTSSLNYPATAPSLTVGQTYAWQVWGVKDGVIATKSEIWTFTVDCSSDTAQTSKDSYRELTDNLDAASYIASGAIHFSFYDPYGPYNMTYSIVDLSKQNKPVKHLPELRCSTGYNKYDLDLTGIGGFTSGDQYLLQFKPIEGKTLLLRFIYMQ
ncbi:MAG TPA: hypothetical protein VL547_07525 [Dinghuibacter sp.]|uniref:hypothetical protein n=1 Tax=Dinghuibacter sp. TaxID=2024697 RepID=UPI002BB358FF|nr:hypothetical protein [Dinghuibacter sp.]HTJ11857.1 hypothetical protein [Dinghuibacter sp.]